MNDVISFSWNCTACMYSHGGYYFDAEVEGEARAKAIRGAWRHWLEKCGGEDDTPEHYAEDPAGWDEMRQEIGPYVRDSNGEEIDWWREEHRPNGKAGRGWHARMREEKK